MFNNGWTPKILNGIYSINLKLKIKDKKGKITRNERKLTCSERIPVRSHRTRWRGTIKMSWWRHQMGTFSALLAPWAGNSPVTGEFRHKGQWHGALVFSLVCAWTNGWINNRDAGGLRRQCAHYDVTVMPWLQMTFYLRMNKPMSKQSWGWWFETPSRSLWRHCNGDAL